MYISSINPALAMSWVWAAHAAAANRIDRIERRRSTRDGRPLGLGFGAPDLEEDYVAGPPDSLLWAAPDRHAARQAQRDLEQLPEPLRQMVQQIGAQLLVVGSNHDLGEVYVNHAPLVARGELFDSGNAKGGPGHWGQYSPRLRLMVVRENRLGSPTVPHEFAHALEDALDPSQTYSVALWNRFSNRQGFLSPYAATRPREYFAVSFAAMFTGYDRWDLRALDPGMEAMLAALLEVQDVTAARRLRFA